MLQRPRRAPAACAAFLRRVPAPRGPVVRAAGRTAPEGRPPGVLGLPERWGRGVQGQRPPSTDPSWGTADELTEIHLDPEFCPRALSSVNRGTFGVAEHRGATVGHGQAASGGHVF